MGAPVLRESFLSLVSRSSGSHTVVRFFIDLNLTMYVDICRLLLFLPIL